MNKAYRMILAATVLLVASVGAAQEEGVALTVYNGDFAMVRETRSLEVGADGETVVTYTVEYTW